MFGVFTFSLTHFLAKIIFFQGVWGVYKIVVEIPEGWGLILVVKNWKFREEGGLTWNSLCGGGMDIFWNYTIHSGLPDTVKQKQVHAGAERNLNPGLLHCQSNALTIQLYCLYKEQA